MTQGNDRSITRIRTFNDDSLRARGEEVPNRPTLKREEKSAQAQTDSILATPTEINLPKKALARKKEKPKKSSEFLAASDETMPVPKEAAPVASKAEEILSKEKLTAEVVIPEEKPKKIVVDKATLMSEVAEIEGNFSNTTTLNEAPQNVSLHDDTVEGTIIQNKKKKRFRLFPAVGSSLTKWFGAKKQIFTEEKEPEHVVNKAETRIATITAAARASYHVPQNDHGITVKRLTAKKRTPLKSSVGIKKKEDVAAPTWTHTTDEPSVDVTVLRMPEQAKPTPAPQAQKAKSSIDTILQERVVEQGPPPEPVFNTPTEKEPETPVAKTEDPEKPATPPAETPLRKPSTTTPVPHTQETPQVKSDTPKKPEKTRKLAKQQSVPQKQTTPTYAAPSRVPIYVYSLVILGASLLGIGTSVYVFMGSTPTEQTVAVRIPSLIQTTYQIPVPLHTNKDKTFTDMINASLTSRETVQIYLTAQNQEGTVTPADAATILNTLNLRAPGSFTRGISEITFGSMDGTNPFILIKTADFDTSFAGMLQWEPVLSSDLSPLFGSPVSESYDPYARTDTQIRSAFFRDTIIANKSARVLADATNTERLVYSFAQQNIILITPNSETFTKILPLITQ